MFSRLLLGISIGCALFAGAEGVEPPAEPTDEEKKITAILDTIIRKELGIVGDAVAADVDSAASLTIPADHPRLAQYIKQGLVRRAPARSWGCEQAAGAPDTDGAGDIVTAWASATPDGQDEWLELTYDAVLKPVEIHVVETYNPGALVKVTTSTDSGMEVVLFKGKDPTPVDAAERRGTSILKVSAAVRTNRIRIHLASQDVPGWNEIDAVGIKDEKGKMHWASSVVASSNYAGGPDLGWILDPAAALKHIDELEAEVQRLKTALDKHGGK